MASALPPSAAGGTPTLSLGVDLSQLQQASAAARAAGQKLGKELETALKQALREQAAAQKQHTAELNAALTQRRVAVKVAAREEVAAQKAALREQVAAEKQYTAQLKAEHQQRVAAARTAAAQQRAIVRGGATFAGAALGGPVGGITGALAGGATAIPLVAGLAVGQAAKLSRDSTQAASDLSEAINKVGVAFDESGQSVLNWSNNSASALGQSRRDALEAASSFGLLFREMGLGSRQSAVMSQRLVELATDMASIHNIRPEEALEKLQAGLVGETRPLREVGVLLNDQVVRQKAVAMGMAETTAAVTDQQKVLARYQLILEQTSRTQGDFKRTITGLANQQRIFNAEWEDFLANTGKIQQGPGGLGLAAVNTVLGTLNDGMEWFNRQTEFALQQWQLLGRVMGGMSLRTAYRAPQQESFDRAMIAAGRTSPSLPSAGRTFTDDQTQLIVDRSRTLANMQRQTDRAVVDSAAQYAKQRADTIANYDKQIAREAEDWGRQRERAEQKYQQSIVDAMREAQDKQIELAKARDEAVADARADSQKQLLDLERDYNKERERSERSHRLALFDAASRLDAVAVMQEQRQYAEDKRTREEDYQDRIADERDNLDEQIAEQEKSYQKQLAVARQASADRIAELTAAYEEQQRIEEDDRQLRLDRQTQDQAAQLAAMDKAQAERIQQIKDNAAEQRQEFDEQFRRDAVAAGIKIQSWIDQNNKVTDEAIKSFDRFMDEVLKRTALGGGTTAGESRGLPVSGGGPILSRALGGPIPRTGLVNLHRGEYVLNPATTTAVRNTMGGGFDQAGLVAALQGGGRSVTWNGDVSVSIAGSTNMGTSEMYAVAHQAFRDALQQVANQ